MYQYLIIGLWKKGLQKYRPNITFLCLPLSFIEVLHQVHPSLIAKEDALEYIESLIISLLGTLCACQPHSVQDVTERVNKTFPDPIDKWANRDASTALEKGKKNSNIVLPVDKIHQALVKV